MFLIRYHVTLIGVRAASQSNMKLNPGLTHILEERDTVFYIGFTREEYSKVHGPANVRHTLWHACATWAVLAMATSGINPYDMEQKYGSQEVKVGCEGQETNADVGEDKNGVGEGILVCEKKEDVKFFVGDNQSIDSMTFDRPKAVKHANMGSKDEVEDGSGNATPSMNGELDDQQRCDVMRGVQLLRFHSMMDTHAVSAPPVKVCLLHRESTNSLSVFQRLSSNPSTHGRPSLASVVSVQQLLPGAGQGQAGATIASLASMPSHLSDNPPHGSMLCSRLSDVPEETSPERSKLERVCADSAQISYSLRDAEEGQVVHDGRCDTIKAPFVPKASHVRKQVSAPEVTSARQSSLLRQVSHQNTKRSSLIPPPLDLNITRSASDGKLSKNVEEPISVAAAMADPDTPNTLRRLGYYSSEQSLLNPSTPSSASRHVVMNMPSPLLARRRPTILNNFSRKLSHIERGVSTQEEVNSS